MSTFSIQYGAQQINLEASEAQYLYQALHEALNGAQRTAAGRVPTIDVKAQHFSRREDGNAGPIETDC